MKKLIIGLLAALALAAVFIGVSSPAEAAGRQTVNRTEFGAIHKGMKMTRVHAIFADPGHAAYRGVQESYYDEIDSDWCYEGDTWACAEQDREYKVRSSWGYVDVDYYRDAYGTWRVSSKHAYWG